MNALTRAVLSFWDSSIGKKILVAGTGIALLLFLPGHLIGNLLLFAGKDAINEYALWLQIAGHGGVVWIARIGLLTVLVVHVLLTIQLTVRNRAVRQKYSHPATNRASRSSRMMIWSGLTILAFIIYHISHFTVRIGNDYNGTAYLTSLPGHEGDVHNVHKMIIDGFSHIGNTVFYVIAITILSRASLSRPLRTTARIPAKASDSAVTPFPATRKWAGTFAGPRCGAPPPMEMSK